MNILPLTQSKSTDKLGEVKVSQKIDAEKCKSIIIVIINSSSFTC